MDINWDEDAGWLDSEWDLTKNPVSLKTTYSNYFKFDLDEKVEMKFIESGTPISSLVAPYIDFYKQSPNTSPKWDCGIDGCPLCNPSSPTDNFTPTTLNNFGQLTGEVNPNVALMQAIPALREMVSCPCPYCTNPVNGMRPREIWATVVHLNDQAGWSREEIADWLETLDADLRFNPPESPENTEGIS